MATQAPGTGVFSAGRAKIAERTLRGDDWRRAPTLTVVLLTAWVVYALVRTASQRAYFDAAHDYLSPFSSPCLTSSCEPGASIFGQPFGGFPPLIPYAIVVLPFLLGFRLTCYYYRRAYYRAYWQSPPACSVPDGHVRYTGETRFPLILQNSHRYFFYAAIVISLINTVDAVTALFGDNGFQIGLGNLVLVANVTLLWAYTLSCHSCRHITGGRLKHFSRHPVRYWMWQQVSRLNTRHMQLAWITLGSLMVTDAYIAISSGHPGFDLRFVN